MRWLHELFRSSRVYDLSFVLRSLCPELASSSDSDLWIHTDYFLVSSISWWLVLLLGTEMFWHHSIKLSSWGIVADELHEVGISRHFGTMKGTLFVKRCFGDCSIRCPEYWFVWFLLVERSNVRNCTILLSFLLIVSIASTTLISFATHQPPGIKHRRVRLLDVIPIDFE